MALSAAERARYDRHLALAEIGAAGQERLQRARVLVAGAGGLGSPAALYLAAAGVGTLGIIDGDSVELSNLQRQVLFTSADLGRAKAEVAPERLLALNPDIAVRAHAVTLTAGNIAEVLDLYELVLDGTDRVHTRYLINDACVLLGKPLVTAAIHRFEGQAMTYVPGRGPCYRCLFAEAQPGAVASCAEAGVLGVLPGVLGAIQATEAIKLLAGSGRGGISGGRARCRAQALRREAARSHRHPREGRFGAGRDRRQGAARVCPRASPRRAHLPGARNLPLGELAEHLAELAGQPLPVFVCRSGRRSLAACEIALRAGLGRAAHLEGGLLAWAAEVDPGFEVAAG